MPSSKSSRSSSDMLPEYDFSGAVRGKYTERYQQGTNLVLLDPDVAERQSRGTSKRKMAKAKTAATQASASPLRRGRAARS